MLHFGTRDEKSAQQVLDDLCPLNLICFKTLQSLDPHERFPPLIAPSEAYISPPLLLTVSGGSIGEDLQTAARLVSKVCIFIPLPAAQAALLECIQGQPFEFPCLIKNMRTASRKNLKNLDTPLRLGAILAGSSIPEPDSIWMSNHLWRCAGD